MPVELTDQERTRARQGHPIDLIDSQTAEAYILIARDRFEQVRAHLADVSEPGVQHIPEGIRVSQAAFRRALPELLKQKRYERRWAAYHREEQIGIAPTGQVLLDICIERGLADDEFYLGWISPCELIEEEEIEPRLHDFGEIIDEDS